MVLGKMSAKKVPRKTVPWKKSPWKKVPRKKVSKEPGKIYQGTLKLFKIFIDWSHPATPHKSKDARRTPTRYHIPQTVGNELVKTVFPWTFFPGAFFWVFFPWEFFLGDLLSGDFLSGDFFQGPFSGTFFLRFCKHYRLAHYMPKYLL